jgi:hypothetical protein
MSTAITTSVTTADIQAYVYPNVAYLTSADRQDYVLYAMQLRVRQ